MHLKMLKMAANLSKFVKGVNIHLVATDKNNMYPDI